MRNIDPKSLGKVAVVLGGTSGEREVSLMSGSGVYNALIEEGVDAVKFDPKEESLERLAEMKPDRVFMILHGKGGEDGIFQGVLEYMKLPYTGSGVLSSAISIDKNMTKLVWASAGVPVPRGMILSNRADCALALKNLGSNLVIKPNKEGSSIGLYKLKNADLAAVEDAYSKAAETGMQVLTEEFVEGRELTVGVLDKGEGRGLEAMPIIEIKAPKGDYDFEHKYYSDETVYVCPAEISSEKTKEIQDAVVKAANLVRASGWSRIDVMLREDGSFALLEINTAPGMTPHSLVPLAARTEGISYGELVKLVAAGASLKG
ncbi:D-alanine--D-alanine ligase [Parasutterella muris]|mgnify:FL=1|jgi:D-alanine--D-alanine ligase|uniref:D-alanine--D-alanine ligase n=1 Tax=Parasutterella muris TaxID=2565572 RepID=A0A6L6YEW1_9BURK|nr:D-alanine--D-alanine ligase [Parasutterella muris]MVX56180.1 D-alanine--D-alanine ligase [Parasutterella muris]